MKIISRRILRKCYTKLVFHKDKILKKTVDIFWCHNVERKRVYIIGTEDYGNLGDHHIAVSIMEFVKNTLPKYEIIEIPATRYYSSRTRLILNIRDEDIIIMTGGGNFGDVYISAQLMRRDIISFWQRNLKIVMPVTVYYKEEFNNINIGIDREAFTKEKNVVIFTRDIISYDFSKKNFSCSVFLTPDIVLSSAYSVNNERANTALLCIRNDLESKLSIYDKDVLYRKIKRKFENICCFDTQKEYIIPITNRDLELLKCIEVFKKTSLVITDRLHGMIFAAITSTPCIVLGNYNHKVSWCYKWLENLDYIFFIDDIDEIDALLDSEFWKKKYQYSRKMFNYEFSVIKRLISGESLSTENISDL